MTMLAYIDHMSGLTGRMLLGALIDAGADRETIETRLSEVAGVDLAITAHQQHIMNVDATCVSIVVSSSSPLSTFEHILATSRATPSQTRLTESLIRLGETAGRIHGVTPEKLTLDQTGGLETILDIIAICTAMDVLQLTGLFHRAIPLSGDLSLTSSTIVALLQDTRIHMVDQTSIDLAGAVILATHASCAEAPAFTLRDIGYGGQLEDEAGPSALIRICIGNSETIADVSDTSDAIQVIETQIDDMNPQYYGYLIDRLLATRALDAFLTPIIMKKGRPAILLTVLAAKAHLQEITALILRETTTIGVRTYPVQRHILPRKILAVDTAYGPIRIKIVRHGDHRRYTPEYDDCIQAAQNASVPLADVYRAVHATADHIDLDSHL